METKDLSIDRLFALLANRRRRYVFYCLDRADANAVVELDELVDQIVAWERNWDGETSESRSDHREDVRINLHHNHLPRIADTPLIDYDPRTETVRCWEHSGFEDWVADDHPERDHLEALL